MRALETGIDGLVLLQPAVHSDERGFLVETFRASVTADLLPGVIFVQENHSRSTRGTVRGLHYQDPPGQSKLVRAVRGAIWDVAVDLRATSPTFGQFAAFELNDEDHRQLFIPRGFAHGFCVLSDVADVVYRLDSYYEPSLEHGVAWNDPDLAIPWPASIPLVSARDQSQPSWSELKARLPEW